MKKLIFIFATCALLLFTSCTVTLTDSLTLPPLADEPGNAGTGPNAAHAPETDGVYLEVSGNTFAASDKISYTYINNTDTAVNILSIPRLELKTAGGWVEVPFCETIGFCGTPDSIAANSRSLDWELDAEYLYGRPLESGHYRLSLDIVDELYEKIDIIYTEFEIL